MGAALVLLVGVALVAGVVLLSIPSSRERLLGAVGSTEAPDPAAPPPGSAATGRAVDPDAPTGWGPTRGEWQEAQDLVATWSPEQLAGGVLVGRYHGTDPTVPADLVEDLHLAGVSVTGANVADEEQVRATTRAVTDAALADGRDHPPVIGVDQEGGYVSHLRGVATEFPAFSAAGRAVTADPRAGSAAVRTAADTTGLELRDLGFTWIFAPVADVTIGAGDAAIGSRSAGSDPDVVARATGSAVSGYLDAGVVATVKHFPGHGTATEDSHDELPHLSSTWADLEARDLVPFRRAVKAGASSVMVAHVALDDVDPGVPATLSSELYRRLREEVGFDGVAITDSMGMGAVAGRPRPAVQALVAGADLVLMPVDTATTHAVVTDAIVSGDLPRARVEEAAARVVALQRWQARVAAETPVPSTVREDAAAASLALSEAGS